MSEQTAADLGRLIAEGRKTLDRLPSPPSVWYVELRRDDYDDEARIYGHGCWGIAKPTHPTPSCRRPISEFIVWCGRNVLALFKHLEAQQAEIARLQDEVDRLESLAEDVVDTHARVVEIEQARLADLESQQAEIARLTQERDEARVERDEYVALTLRAQAFQQREMDVAAATTATLEAREAAIARVAAALRQIARDIESQGHSCTEIDADLPGHLDTLADQLAPTSPQEAGISHE